MPLMRAEAGTDLIDVEEELVRRDDSSYLPSFPALIAYVLWLDLIGLHDFQLRHARLLEQRS
jgi:hypothetical protein